MKKILIIGSGEDFIDVVNIAKSKKLYVIVCDGVKEGVAKKYADKYYDIDINDYDSIERIIKREKIDAIFTSFSDKTLKVYADMCKKFDLNCTLTPELVELLINKQKMKNKFLQDSIPTAKFTYIGKDFFENEIKDLKFPLVMKPLVSSGSKGIFIVNNIQEIRENIQMVLSTCNNEKLIINKILLEEFIEGEEVIISAWVCNGKPYIQFINDRELYIKDKGRAGQAIRNIIPSKHIKYIEKEAENLLNNIVSSFKFKNGPCIIQTILSKEGLKVIEVLGRISGVNDHKVNEKIGGINTLKLFFDYILNGKVDIKLLEHDDKIIKKSCIFFPVILKSGVIGDIENLNEVKKLSFVSHIDKMKNIGDEVKDTGDMMSIAGRIFIVAENLYLAYKYEKIVKEKLKIKDIEGKNMIDNF